MDPNNPYQSPQSPSQPDHATDVDWPLLPEGRWPELDIRVVNFERGWWTRRIEVAGSIKATIYYNAQGVGEELHIDNHHLLTTSALQWENVCPRIDFHVKCDGYLVPARIDVAASLLRLLSISKFRLTIAGRTIYEE